MEKGIESAGARRCFSSADLLKTPEAAPALLQRTAERGKYMERKRRVGWKHITERERYLLEYMLKVGMKVADIAAELGHSKSTIYREIKRGKVLQRNSDYTEEERYLADYAQRDYNEKKHEKGRYLKI